MGAGTSKPLAMNSGSECLQNSSHCLSCLVFLSSGPSTVNPKHYGCSSIFRGIFRGPFSFETDLRHKHTPKGLSPGPLGFTDWGLGFGCI